jgi:branched-chain amino acid transport system substrate-binding protein
MTWVLTSVVLLASSAAARDARADEPYELNAILSLTGTAAYLGQAESQSLGLLERIVNQSGGIHGRLVHVNVADDQSNPQLTVQLAGALINKNVPVILGPSVTATCNALAPLIRDHGPVDYCFSPGVHPTASSYMFAASVPTVTTESVVVRYFRVHRLTRIALIASTDGSGQEGERSLNEALAKPENKRVTLVATEHFNPSDLSVRAQLVRIKEANPQVLYASTAGTPFGTVLRALTDVGLDVSVSTGAGNLSTPQMIQYANLAVGKVYIAGPLFLGMDLLRPGPVKRAQRSFFAAHQAVGVKAGNANGLGWDPTLIVIDALRVVGAETTSTQLRDAIGHTHDFIGIDGRYDYAGGSNPWGLTEQSVIMTHWDPARDLWLAVGKPGGAP